MDDLLGQWWNNAIIQKAISATLGLLIIVGLTRFLRNALGRQIILADKRYRFRKFISLVGTVIAAMFLLTVFSGQLGTLAMAFGVASAGIAFALQEVIASIAGWLATNFIHFYKVGDRVQLGGIRGDVIDIGILRTTLMEIGGWVEADQYNGRIVRVANSFIFKEPVFNYSADFPYLWDELKIPVKYGGDVKLAQSLLEKVINEFAHDLIPEAEAAWRHMMEKYPLQHSRIPPSVTMVANDNWLEFTVRYVVDYKRRRAVKDRLFKQIVAAFDATEGRVAIASMTVQIVETPPFDVRLNQRNQGGD